MAFSRSQPRISDLVQWKRSSISSRYRFAACRRARSARVSNNGGVMQLRGSSLAVAALLLGGLPALTGCEKPKAEAASEPEAPEIGVVTAEARAMTLVRELPGRVAPTRVADV